MNEDAVVTTTDNGGNGLDSPKLPINNNIFRRVKKLIDKSKKPKSLI